jgi:hypothetical protein
VSSGGFLLVSPDNWLRFEKIWLRLTAVKSRNAARIRRNFNNLLMLYYAHVSTKIGFVRRISIPPRGADAASGGGRGPGAPGSADHDGSGGAGRRQAAAPLSASALRHPTKTGMEIRLKHSSLNIVNKTRNPPWRFGATRATVSPTTRKACRRIPILLCHFDMRTYANSRRPPRTVAHCGAKWRVLRAIQHPYTSVNHPRRGHISRPLWGVPPQAADGCRAHTKGVLPVLLPLVLVFVFVFLLMGRPAHA